MRAPSSPALFALPLAMALALGACATPPDPSDPDAVIDYEAANDPLEPTNRVIYQVNDAIDTVILRPVALAYRTLVPDIGRAGVRNVLDNLQSPVVLANDMLQGKPKRAGDTFMRLIINSTMGFGGVFDPATGMGYPSHASDFGMTLAVWGVGEGPYVYLPLFGPSNPRDAVGRGVDIAADPFNWISPNVVPETFGYTRTGVNAVDHPFAPGSTKSTA